MCVCVCVFFHSCLHSTSLTIIHVFRHGFANAVFDTFGLAIAVAVPEFDALAVTNAVDELDANLVHFANEDSHTNADAYSVKNIEPVYHCNCIGYLIAKRQCVDFRVCQSERQPIAGRYRLRHGDSDSIPISQPNCHPDTISNPIPISVWLAFWNRIR